MITRTDLPPDYHPYHKLTLCSNVLVGGGHLLEIHGVLPIVVGKGPVPLVWLQAPMDTKGKEFVLLVSASVARHSALSILQSDSGVSVRVANSVVLHVYAPNSNEAVVDKLDLRPIGYAVYGDERGLFAGGMSFYRNTAERTQVLISLGAA